MYDIHLFSNRLKGLRKTYHLSQKELAEKTDFSQSAIAKWELGMAQPSGTAIVTLAEFFNETTDYILGFDEIKDK